MYLSSADKRWMEQGSLDHSLLINKYTYEQYTVTW